LFPYLKCLHFFFPRITNRMCPPPVVLAFSVIRFLVRCFFRNFSVTHFFFTSIFFYWPPPHLPLTVRVDRIFDLVIGAFFWLLFFSFECVVFVAGCLGACVCLCFRFFVRPLSFLFAFSIVSGFSFLYILSPFFPSFSDSGCCC